MPKVCIVNDCPSNLRAEGKVSLHRLPISNSELLERWEEKLDFRLSPTIDCRICSLHFNENSFEQHGKSKQLSREAVPLEFKASGQKILSNQNQTANIKVEIEEIEPLTFVDSVFINDEDSLEGFSEFAQRLSSSKISLKDNWNVFEQPDGVCLYRLKRDENFKNVTMTYKIIINSEMLVSLYQNENEADIEELNWILKNSKLEFWSQFLSLTSHYQTEPEVKPGRSSHLMKQALDVLNKIHDSKQIREMIEPIKLQLKFSLNRSEANFPELCKFETNSSELDDEADSTHEAFSETDASFKEKTRKRSFPKKTKQSRKERSDQNTLSCSRCEKVFNSRIQLSKHRHEEYYCDQCGKKIMSKRSLQQHVLRAHAGGLARIPCQHCGELMTTGSMKRHIKSRHEGLKPFACPVCEKSFAAKTAMQQHLEIHNRAAKAKNTVEEDGKVFFECPKCSKRLERGGIVFASHVANCSGILTEKRKQYRYKCFECGKNFQTRIACAEHLATQHNFHVQNIKNFCFICKEEFEDLVMHTRIHNCPFQCSMCGGRFIEQERLDKHIRLKHKKDEVRPFSCDQCSASFKILNHLRSHQKITHSQAEKQFTCDHCEKAFVFKYLLTAHVQFAHSDVRRFSCNFCGVKFKGSSQMKIHCKTVHGEENVYPCTKCSIKFRTLNELKNHLQDEHGISMNLQKYHDA